LNEKEKGLTVTQMLTKAGFEKVEVPPRLSLRGKKVGNMGAEWEYKDMQKP